MNATLGRSSGKASNRSPVVTAARGSMRNHAPTFASYRSKTVLPPKYVPSSAGFAGAFGEPSGFVFAAMGAAAVFTGAAAARLFAGGAPVVGSAAAVCGGIKGGRGIFVAVLFGPAPFAGGSDTLGVTAAAFGTGAEFDGTEGFVVN